MEKIRLSKGHSPTGHREGQVRTRKEPNKWRSAYQLETASGGLSQDTERIRLGEGHSHPGDDIGRDKSGHGKNQTERGVLTNWGRHREEQVRTRKESDRARGTYELETSSEGTSQDTERIRLSEGHSHPGECHREGQVRTRKNQTERGALTSWRQHQGGGEDKSGPGRNSTKQGALTNWI